MERWLKSDTSRNSYGNTLTQLFSEDHTHNVTEGEFVGNLRIRMQALRPSPTTNNSAHAPFMVMNAPPYEGPFPVVERNDKFFKVKIRGKDVNISIDRLKSAFVAEDSQNPSNQTTQPKEYQTKSGRRVRFCFSV